VLVRVLLLQPLLVHVGVGVDMISVGVLMLVLGVLVLMLAVGVRVHHLAMRVFMGVWMLVRVLVVHHSSLDVGIAWCARSE